MSGPIGPRPGGNRNPIIPDWVIWVLAAICVAGVIYGTVSNASHVIRHGNVNVPPPHHHSTPAGTCGTHHNEFCLK